MSAACQPKSSPTKATNIQIKRVLLSDPSQLPCDLSSTPGGTLFSTTPGGTRLVYDRSFLLECRNSPLANSPPAGLPRIPGVTCVAPGGQHPKNSTSPGGKFGHGHVPHGHGGHHVAHHGHGPAHGQAMDTAGHVSNNPAPQQPQQPVPAAAPQADDPLFEMDI